MSTTLANCRILLSKQIADYWASTTTTAGNAGGTTYIDTALMAKSNEWIADRPQEMYDLITSVSSGSNLDNERRILSLDNTTGTITCLAHTGQVLTATGYEIHRLFSPSEKRRALIHACKAGFPGTFTRVRDTSLTVGNWLMDGDLEHGWTTTTANSYWTASASTMTQTTTAKYYCRGATSMAISAAVGYVYQDMGIVTDFAQLSGHTVTFSAQTLCTTASAVRLSIYDGTTTTYSSYHTGGGGWEELEVTATIKESPTDVRFSAHLASASATAYVDDLRVIGPIRDKLYIGNLGLAKNQPHAIEEQYDDYISYEPWVRLHNYEVGSDDYLYLGEGTQEYQLRVSGIGYLDFLASGVSSAAWTATIVIDSPQTEILIAEAVMYLYTQMVTPNYTSGDRDKFAQILQYWEAELERRKQKFGMKAPLATVKWT